MKKQATAHQPLPEAQKRAAIYIRVSTKKQEDGYSYEFQKEQALCHSRHKMAAKNGITWPITQTFTLTLSSQNRLCNSISWPKGQKSSISWPEVLFKRLVS